MNPLKVFYDDSNMREAVKAFLLEGLNDLAVERVFSKQDVVGIAESKEVIEKQFSNLEDLFAVKKPFINETPR